MATARDIIEDAAFRMGIYAAGETMTDADAQRMLVLLNDMLDEWSNESLACFATVEQSAALTAGTASYTIGTGGTFNMTRPIRLIGGPGAAYVTDTNGNKYYMDVVGREEFNLLGNTSSQVTSNFPNTLFYDNQFPLGIMNFYPYPNGASTAFWDSYLQLTDFSGLSTTVSLPPGYKSALGKNLAVEAWEDFQTKDLPASLLRKAMEAKGTIKRANLREIRAVYDPEIVARANTAYNIYTDSYNR